MFTVRVTTLRPTRVVVRLAVGALLLPLLLARLAGPPLVQAQSDAQAGSGVERAGSAPSGVAGRTRASSMAVPRVRRISTA